LREVFWPAAGSKAVGCLVAALLAIVLSVLLPQPVRWLNVGVAALVALGIARGHAFLAGLSILYVGLAWMAGCLAFAPFQWALAGLAVLFSLAAWGVLQVARGRLSGLWFLHGAQLAVAGILLAQKQSLAAGVVVSLVLGEVLSHQTPRFGEAPTKVAQRTWPWLLVVMLVAAWASP
jgi:hypothetical protein